MTSDTRAPQQGIAELGRSLRQGLVSAQSLTEKALEEIASSQPHLRAFTRVDAEGARRAAKVADQELQQGLDRGPMHGIPYALKDIYDVEGMPTTCSSNVLDDDPKAIDSEVASRFRAAGAVLVGKLTTHEFAIGTPTEETGFSPARNPWSQSHITGGSSSGSGAIVGAGILRLATGTDTAGSIRGPAAWCGAVGLKPTYGRVSRRGVFPLAWTLDHCGPIAGSVEDCAIALQVMAGHDPLDPASADVPVADYRAGLDGNVQGLRIGVPRAFFRDSPLLSDEVRTNIDETVARLTRLGAIVEDVELPDFKLFTSSGRVILAAEMYAIHREMLAKRSVDYHPLTVSRICVGSAISAADYLNALRVRSELMRSTNRILTSCDVLLTAISLASAPLVAAGMKGRDWPLQQVMFNVTGHPAMSLPTGLNEGGLPMGIQLVGRPFDEATLLRVAYALESDSGPLPQPETVWWQSTVASV